MALAAGISAGELLEYLLSSTKRGDPAVPRMVESAEWSPEYERHVLTQVIEEYWSGKRGFEPPTPSFRKSD
jgi:hypothetical protein